MSALMEMFTATPQLSAGQRNYARAEGRRFFGPVTLQPTVAEEWRDHSALAPASRKWDLRNPSRHHCAFAQRSHDHQVVYLIFSFMTRQQVVELREAMKEGHSTAHWPWPMTHAPKIIQRLNWNDRQEMWRLFEEGGEH